MQEIPFYQVDAFAETTFSGNPAAVCILSEWLSDTTLQSIAMENNLSETAFVVCMKDRYHIRWFTPTTEVELCGHATLASAYILVSEGYWDHSTIIFDSMSGMLSVEVNEDTVSLDFPSQPPKPVEPPSVLWEALGIPPSETHENDDLLVHLENEDAVRRLNPDFTLLKQVPARGVIVTAPGSEVDFVSRFFGPRVGVDEDPVTGSAHCLLIPFWAKRLKKTKLSARQISRRGGHLNCEYRVDRVTIKGKAKTVIKGCFYLN